MKYPNDTVILVEICRLYALIHVFDKHFSGSYKIQGTFQSALGDTQMCKEERIDIY